MEPIHFDAGVLPGSTQIHDLIRLNDWSASPLGPPAGWPQSLRYILTMMLESTIPMSVVWGPERVLLYNESYVQFLGAKHPTQAFGLPIRDVWPEIWTEIGPLIERAAGGDAFYLEDVPLTISRNGIGEAAWFTFSYSPVRDDDGALNGMCSAVLETTSRVLAGQQQAFLLTLASALAKLTDPQTIMHTAARMACTYLGVHRVMYAEPNFDDDVVTFLPGHADDAVACITGQYRLSSFGTSHIALLASGENVIIDDVLTDSAILDDSVRNNYMELGARSVVGIPLMRTGKAMAEVVVNHAAPRVWKPHEVALLREFSEYTWNAVERARAERDLLYLAATLEERVAEKTAELRRADKDKDQFLAMLAHELRNPLAPISAATSILNIQGLPAEQIAKTSAVIDRQVKHMVGMIDDLLDVSRVTSGRIVLECQPVSIDAVISDAVEQVQPLFETRNHSLSTKLTGASVLVNADAKRLVQVFANILSNAAKYTAPDAAIDVAASAEEATVTIVITDNGIGIPADVLPCVFDLFVQGVRTSDRSQGGLGIGLALVRSLVGLHDGVVTIASADNECGTTVTVVLPRWHAAAAQHLQVAAVLAHASTANLRRRVMVVDDNVDAGNMLTMALEHLGYAVTFEANPLQALQRAGTEAFDIFLLDIGMPDLDGHELAKRLRMQPGNAKANIIAVSGYGTDAARQTARAAGFDHYVQKPAVIANLVTLLNGSETASDALN